eukprot:CAMPEP_0113902102 /NCGR_PEP_ID=MMETSP0780_2-20120614/21649_1 /TAXON_ID=652834 /ORGANISM="Palpitomonas bilix" /LENGTH=401 /DNA_ID=CAMNT_0000894841 /DNA_START=3164 /DNA_END=4369 /DNA_ORIENTATION=- /assembly_acc=CAM_ASM_000599
MVRSTAHKRKSPSPQKALGPPREAPSAPPPKSTRGKGRILCTNIYHLLCHMEQWWRLRAIWASLLQNGPLRPANTSSTCFAPSPPSRTSSERTRPPKGKRQASPELRLASKKIPVCGRALKQAFREKSNPKVAWRSLVHLDIPFRYLLHPQSESAMENQVASLSSPLHTRSYESNHAHALFLCEYDLFRFGTQLMLTFSPTSTCKNACEEAMNDWKAFEKKKSVGTDARIRKGTWFVDPQLSCKRLSDILRIFVNSGKMTQKGPPFFFSHFCRGNPTVFCSRGSNGEGGLPLSLQDTETKRISRRDMGWVLRVSQLLVETWEESEQERSTNDHSSSHGREMADFCRVIQRVCHYRLGEWWKDYLSLVGFPVSDTAIGEEEKEENSSQQPAASSQQPAGSRH